MKIIDVEDIKIISSKMRKNLASGNSFSEIAAELNEILLREYGISIRDSIIKYCRDNFKDVTPSVQPILAEAVNQIVLKAVNEGETDITLNNPSGLYNLAEGIGEGITIKANGPVGGLFGAYNNGAVMISKGVAGRYSGNNAWKGLFVFYGDIDEGFGLANYGADFIIFGKAMTRAFAQAKGGSALVRNGLGDYSGMYMADGILVCFDGELGNHIGSGMVGGAIYVPRDKVKETTLGDGTALIEKLDEDDLNQLRSVFQKYNRVEGFSFEVSGHFPTASFNGNNYSTTNLAKIVKK